MRNNEKMREWEKKNQRKVIRLGITGSDKNVNEFVRSTHFTWCRD